MQKPTPFTVRSRIAPRGGRAGGAGPRPFSGNISCIRANRVILIMFCYYFFLFPFVDLAALCVLLPPPSPWSNQCGSAGSKCGVYMYVPPVHCCNGAAVAIYYTTHPPFALSSPPRRPDRERYPLHVVVSTG